MLTERSGIVLLALAALLFAGLPAQAQVVNLKAELSGKAEVPPNEAKGSGSATLTFDPATKTLSWKGMHSGMSVNPSAAHFHGPAEPGKNAGVLIPIPNPGPTFEGSAQLTDAQAADLLAGRLYINLHTPTYPGGELRGQVVR